MKKNPTVLFHSAFFRTLQIPIPIFYSSVWLTRCTTPCRAERLRGQPPCRRDARWRGDRQLPRPVACGAVLPDVQDRPTSPAHVPPHQGRDRSPSDHRVQRAGTQPRSTEPGRARDPQPDPPTTTASFSHHRDQRHRADIPTRHPRPQTSSPQRDPGPAGQALNRPFADERGWPLTALRG